MIPPPERHVVERFERDLAGLLDPPRKGEYLLALGVSGGPDSLALLLLAHAAQPCRVIAATVDHGLRAEAAAEANAVAMICTKLGVPHTTLAVSVPDDPSGLQSAARTARYAALESWATSAGAIGLATAHHLDDQAETVLMRLARGAGIAGLTGIRRVRPLPGGLKLLRPLLGWRRAELGAIVAQAGLTAADDPSNHNPRFDRTRARALLAQGWPESTRLAAVAAHAEEAEAALAFATERFAAERLMLAEGGATLSVTGLPREFRRRLVLRVLKELTDFNHFRGDEVDRLLDRLAAGHVSTLAGIRIAPGPVWHFTIAPPRRSV